MAKTVFIIGAGASWHYGYPTGQELVESVRKKASSVAIYFKHASMSHAALKIRPDFVKRRQPDLPTDSRLISSLRQQLEEAASEANDLAARLKAVDPLVIDYFIGHNRHLEDIAKLCIAWEILEREANPADRGPMTQNNWCRFLIHKLVSGCMDGPALLTNNVSFVTFNYDLSLEHRLWRGLCSLRLFDNITTDFLHGNRIIHIYGKIRENENENNRSSPLIKKWELGDVLKYQRALHDPSSQIWDDGKRLLDHIYAASRGISTIAPDKASMSPVIEKARQIIAEAECVYILGYGFDSTNNKLLDLPNSLRAGNKWKHVLLTNFRNSGVVNKNASRMFFNGNANLLLAERAQVVEQLTFTCEKSISDVYHALAFDFDVPEERPNQNA
jgi:hypothetical protein